MTREASAETALWGLMLRALADARTQANPHDPAVEAYWRERIARILARTSGREPE